MSAGSHSEPVQPQHCPSCGLPVGMGDVFCGSCGRTLVAPTMLTSGADGQPPVPTPTPTPSAPLPLSATAPTVPAWPGAGQPLAPGEWSATVPAMPAGMAALAATPVAPPPSRWKRRGLIAGIAALCIVALLSAGAYWVFAAFLSPTNQTTSARYLPDTTVFYASVDLVAAAASPHQFNGGQIAQQAGGANAFQTATGLNWQTDIAPWVGRLATFAVIPGTLGSAGAAAGTGPAPVGEVLLLQSRDDGAAQRAVAKALAFQGQRGATFTQTTYGGYTLHTGNEGGSPISVIATGRGLVILASAVDAAHSVIDRANGTGNTLAGNSDFQKATGDLPTNRFGTMFLNLRALTDPLSTGASMVDLPFVGTYPTAAGALLWTNTGFRWQVTFKAARSGVPQDALTGDTTSLASMVPSDAAAYIGAANTGPLIRDAAALVSPSGQGTAQADALAPLGIATTDPAISQPSAIFVLPGSSASSSPTGGMLVRAPDPAAAQTLLKSIAAHNQWTSQATTVDGVPATAFYADSTTAGFSTTRVAFAGAFTATRSATANNLAAPKAATPVAVAATINGTLVVATTVASLTEVIDTANGTHANLAQSGTFHQLTATAPTGGALTAYVDVPNVDHMLIPALSSSTIDPTHQATGEIFTLVWNTTQLQGTFDVGLSH